MAEYLIDLNATQAAIRAGYSAKTAESQASRLLTNAKVREAVAQEQQEIAKKAALTAEQVLLELARIASSDIRKLYRPDGSLKSPLEWDDEIAAAVAGVDVVEMANDASDEGNGGSRHTPMYTKKVRLWDKVAAIEKAMKHLALFADRLELTGAKGGPIATSLVHLSDAELEEMLIACRKKSRP